MKASEFIKEHVIGNYVIETKDGFYWEDAEFACDRLTALDLEELEVDTIRVDGSELIIKVY